MILFKLLFHFLVPEDEVNSAHSESDLADYISESEEYDLGLEDEFGLADDLEADTFDLELPNRVHSNPLPPDSPLP